MELTHAQARPLNTLPGPAGLPLLGNMHQIEIPRLHQQLERWAAEYGPIYRLRMGPLTRVCIADADTINLMLRDRPEIYRRRRALEAVMTEMGFNGVFSQDGEAWRRQRKVVVHALNPAHLTRFYPALARTTTRLFNRWQAAARAARTVDICRDLMRFTVDVTAHLAFGIDVNTLETEGPVIQQYLDKVFPMLFRRVTAPLPYWRYFKLSADRQLDHALAEIRSRVVSMTATCRERMQTTPSLYEHPTNFLEAIIAAKEHEGLEFSDDEIYANIVTLLLAGEDTTAITLAWAVNFFIEHPQHYRRARAEADAALAPHDVAPDLDAIRALEFIDAFTHETMRFKPVAPLQGIEPKQDVELLGYHVPAGTDLIAVMRPAALSDAHFAHAASFDPERWLTPEDAAHQPHNPRAFMPFGAGPRFCPGRGLAMLEIKAVLAMLCRGFEVSRAEPAAPITERLAFTMLPENLLVRLQLRAA